MSWILEHINLVIIGALVIGSFLKSRFDALKQDQQEPDELPDFETYEETQRSSPPAMPYVPPRVERTPPQVPVQRSAERPPVFAATRSQSGAMTASADEAAIILQKQRDIEERLRVIREARPAKSGSKSSIRPRAITGKPVPVAAVPTSIRGRLRNPSELRRAIVMREILDPPVGLR